VRSLLTVAGGCLSVDARGHGANGTAHRHGRGIAPTGARTSSPGRLIAGVESLGARFEQDVSRPQPTFAAVQSPFARLQSLCTGVESPFARLQSLVAAVESVLAAVESVLAAVESVLAAVQSPFARLQSPISSCDGRAVSRRRTRTIARTSTHHTNSRQPLADPPVPYRRAVRPSAAPGVAP